MHPSKTLDPDVRHPGSVLLARTADALGRRPAGPQTEFQGVRFLAISPFDHPPDPV